MPQNPPQERPLSFTPEHAPRPEQSAPSPEQSREQLPSREQQQSPRHETRGVEGADGMKKRLAQLRQKPAHIPQVRDALTMQVEKIMEEGLRDAYKAMTPVQQQEFKIKGEQTALQIRSLLKKTHIRVKKIFRLLLDWLKLVPGVNKFFLEQEAKIKADRIMAIHKVRNIQK